MSSILKIEKLSHRYATNWAVRDINLEIQQNGVIGLLGSNGAGKSTIMNIVCGVLNQTEGQVTINGADTRKESELAKQHIGFLPQNPPLYTDLTVNEYLTYTAELRMIEGGKIKAAVEEAKEKTGIAHFSSRLIKNLSGGYRQRVGIAQAIIHKPKLVVMDEPTNGLDPNQLIEARKLIREISQERTVLLSSHILSEIHLLCREVIMIESGRIIFSDTMDAFNNYLQPHSLLVKFGNPPSITDLMQVKGITKAEFLTDKQARIFFDGDEEIAERVIAAGVSQEWRIREINPEKGLLDDIFKQLSSQSLQ
ncbi:ABC transporter ATP-binding protein [Pseudobacter ginsenosidimutans]|jgi:ABC-2 type transport system ATP-binding protein|uniref:ABC-2 type transport system ATP-binding protein n=1 Tax=Pseudobacter ginsenosidimutans TaxID=661488 RepID=A0A4Q7MCK2_9BACT|nr:ABC transporter ATP-binding protein [Pseudobacter ginsenosidimutans]QEC45321.1 ABC transporter ATP-binding protein [Pseudobacter ginsenosidimutans]RZS65591.1 ABC-2 type transport system ATP-binding protein [Pseudobacter ginsenosidimutans]